MRKGGGQKSLSVMILRAGLNKDRLINGTSAPLKACKNYEKGYCYFCTDKEPFLF